MKHTPGPWRVEDDDRLDRCAFIPVHAGDGSSWKAVAEVHPAYGVEPEGVISEEDRANARLIAAAPDHALVGWAMCVQDATWEEWDEKGRGEFCFAGLRHVTRLDEFGVPTLTDNLRAILAKATGVA